MRRKSDGLFATKYPSRIVWTTRGTIWNGNGPLKLSLANGVLANIKSPKMKQLYEIVVLEIKETGILEWEKL